LDIDRDIRRIGEQECRLHLKHFDENDAWALGEHLKRLAEERSQTIFIEIRKARETVFLYGMPGTTPGNADWIRRKRNTVELLQRSSYGVGRSLEKDKTSLEAKMGLPTRDYASHGGGFPLRVSGVGFVGVVTVSGLPQRADHALAVEALATFCGVAFEDIALDTE
jgi:uncharacterized protein (UPF0303 family)